MRNKFPSRVDRNQPEIVSAFRKRGCSVALLHEAGRGIYDLLVAKHGFNVLVEVKDGLKEPSERHLTPQQHDFNFMWLGMRCVVINVPQALCVVDQLDALAETCNYFNMARAITGSTESIYQPQLRG